MTIGVDGIVSAVLPGQADPVQVGTLQLTDFVNPGGLQPRGENLYIETVSSGPPQPGTPGLNGLGTLAQGALETSNVSVVEELVSMIETQRAYEMNSRAIESSDQMLQTPHQPLIGTLVTRLIRLPVVARACAARGVRASWRLRPSTISPSDFRPTAPLEAGGTVTAGGVYDTVGSFDLFMDLRARAVGDILTVVLVERTAASKESSTSTAKGSSIDTGFPVILGKPPTHQRQLRS